MVTSRLEVLERLAGLASATDDLGRVLGDALDVLVGALEGAVGGAYIVPDPAAQPSSGAELLSGRGPVGGALADYLRRTWEAQGPAALPQEPCLISEGVAGVCPDVRALVAFPLRAQDATVGAVVVGLGSEPDPDSLDMGLFRLVGRAVGLAIDNARLVGDVRARLRRSQALYNVSRALAATLDLDHLLSLVVAFAVDTIDKATSGVLHLLDEVSGELHPRAMSFQPGTLPDTSGRNVLRLGHGVAGRALDSGRLVNLPDVSQDPVSARGAHRFASMMVAPLLLGDRRIGTLTIEAKESHAFGEEDEQLLLTLATMAAAAIDNARLISDLQESLNSLKMTQEQLVQSARLSAVGQLISGVAHELNNPLTAIMGYVQLLGMAAGMPASARTDLEKIRLQAQRAAEIVQSLLTFARQRRQEAERVNVNEVLRRTMELRAYQLRRDEIEIVADYADDAPGILVAPDQLQQVILQLVNNAYDALCTVDGPRRLTLATERAGETVRIRVADNGPGLSAEARSHLFEPFFTTKEVGQGTGLGLSICFGIVNQYGGRIYAEEDRGGPGATFVVEFPVAREPIVGQEPAGADGEERPNRAPACRVLVVDDEPDVASLLEAILTEDDHQVETATRGDDALALLATARREERAFDLILSDIHMPGMEGPEFYDRLVAQDPPMARRLVFVTGDALDPGTREFLHAHRLTYVSKPFSLDELGRALDQVWSQGAGRPLAEPETPAADDG
ncbi:MAG: GAF domain-containing protein [Chloroflexi bacterium]|nr:GAF domain-containing protein [Chloroflexota bacterium]